MPEMHHQWLRRVWQKIQRRRKYGYWEPTFLRNPEPFLRKAFADQEELCFIQIGANDGVNDDQLWPFLEDFASLNGIAMEPLPEVFDRLVNNRGSRKGVQFLNAAVAHASGKATIYTVDDSQSDRDLSVISSFSREHLLSFHNLLPDIAERIKDLTIDSMSFEDVASKLGTQEIDILYVDTEGFDYEVIKMVDLDKWQIKLLFFEAFFMSFEQAGDLVSSLNEKGYTIRQHHRDYIAWRPDLLSP